MQIRECNDSHQKPWIHTIESDSKQIQLANCDFHKKQLYELGFKIISETRKGAPLQ